MTLRAEKQGFIPILNLLGQRTSSAKLEFVDDTVSIRAPPSHAGRRDAAEVVRLPLRVSIRAPRSHAGRPSLVTLAEPLNAVSIRAPRSHAGRRAATKDSASIWKFQSAPRVLTR